MSEETPEPPNMKPPSSLEGKYHFCIVPDVSAAPQWLASDDLDALMKDAHRLLVEAQSGWGYFIIDGKRCLISNAHPLFYLRMPDNTLKHMTSPAGPTFSSEGRFVGLVPAVSPL